jgi:UDP-N-acetylmuramyl pentapeptide phosphotransferase/UDP-N-acetylglucosamine-1-phosphate transferase
MRVSGLLLVVVCAGLCAGTIALRLRRATFGLDLPGQRSLHVRPTPHGGGLGIVLAALVALLWLGLPGVWVGGVLLLAGISVVDDWRPLPFWSRLPVHVLVAAGVVFLHMPAAWWLVGGLVLLLAWGMNAYNFMDGADGLAGCMSAVGFAAYALAFLFGGQPVWAVFCVVLAVAALVFLAFNWHPARIFMGDVGSVPLGFLAGGLGWLGVALQVWPGWFPLLVFAPFLLDATLTLLRRMLRRERFWEAHREHAYQRMVRMGLTHAQMSRRWLWLMLAGATLALLGLGAPLELGAWLAAAWYAGLTAAWWQVQRRWQSRNE